MAKQTVEELAQLSADERVELRSAALERVETRIGRATAEHRDLTEREASLSRADRDELEALTKADGIVEYRAEMGAAIQAAADNRPSGALRDFAEALGRGVPYRAAVECRSITTAVAGARGAVAVNGVGRPEWLWAAAGIPSTPADSLTVQGPLWDALVAQSATTEGSNKPAMGDPALASATLRAFAVTSTVTDQVLRFGVGPTAVAERLASESIFSVNAAIADALETAAGTPVTYATSASHMADRAIAKVWAQTGAKPTALLVNSADYPLLSDKAAVGPGDGIGTTVVAFNGTVLLVNDSITAGIAVAVNGATCSAHTTDVLLASLPNLTNNTTLMRAETYFALLAHDAGAIVAVELAA